MRKRQLSNLVRRVRAFRGPNGEPAIRQRDATITLGLHASGWNGPHPLDRVISSPRAPRTSPDRAAVKITNSHPSFTAGVAALARTLAIASATSLCGNARWCFLGPLGLGDAAPIASLAAYHDPLYPLPEAAGHDAEKESVAVAISPRFGIPHRRVGKPPLHVEFPLSDHLSYPAHVPLKARFSWDRGDGA